MAIVVCDGATPTKWKANGEGGKKDGIARPGEAKDGKELTRGAREQ